MAQPRHTSRPSNSDRPLALDRFSSLEFRSILEREDSLDYAPFVYFTDRLLHEYVFLPSRISGKMSIFLDIITIIAMLVAWLLSLCLFTYHLYVKPPDIAMKSL